MKYERSVHLPLVAYVPYINWKSWMFHTSPVQHGRPVHHTCKNYVDGDGKLPEDQEGDGNAGNLCKLILA